MPATQSIALVVPSAKLSGGTLEVVRLAREWRAAGHQVCLIEMWQSPHPIEAEIPSVMLSRRRTNPLLAMTQLPVISAAFVRASRKLPASTQFVFTHYATLALAPFVPRRRRWIFVQDLEWTFVPSGPLRTSLAAFLLWNMRRARLLSTNAYLTGELRRLDLDSVVAAPIWADPTFLDDRSSERTHDVLVPLRKGAHKRSDLAYRFIAILREQRPDARIAIVTTEDGHEELVSDKTHIFRRLDRTAMRDLYLRCRTIVLLSDHEGFGLPPLEAMGCGCVPVVRDAGGPRVYMTGSFAPLMMDLAAGLPEIAAQVGGLLDDPDRLERLSEEARAIFAMGLERTRSVRDALANAGLPCDEP